MKVPALPRPDVAGMHGAVVAELQKVWRERAGETLFEKGEYRVVHDIDSVRETAIIRLCNVFASIRKIRSHVSSGRLQTSFARAV